MARDKKPERRTRWNFGCREDNTWFWVRTLVDGTAQESEGHLETLADCLRDATRYGFEIWSRGDERRHDETERLLAKIAESAQRKH
jgi:hypothetical protein